MSTFTDNESAMLVNPEVRPKPWPRNTKVIVAVVIAVSLIVVLGILLLVFLVKKQPTPILGKPFEFNDIFNRSLQPKYSSLSFSSSEFFTYTDDQSNIWAHNYETGQNQVLLNTSVVLNASTAYSNYYVSSAGHHVALATNVSSIWRHSFKANYYVYTPDPVPGQPSFRPFVPDNPQLLNFVWNPAFEDMAAYVMDNNIYMRDIDSQDETTQVTFDGSPVIFNGVQSWVYEEEIFSDNNAMWWSPDGTSLAYLRSDESRVPIYSFPVYENNDAYTPEVKIPYPKPGYPNPSVTLRVFDWSTNQTFVFNISAAGNFEYVASVQWGPDGNVYAQLLNREQTKLSLFKIDAANKSSSLVYERSHAKGWITVNELFIIEDYIVTIESVETMNHNHIVLRNLGNGQVANYLTTGDYDVTSIVGYSNVTHLIYFLSAEVAPTQRHLYTVDFHANKTMLTQDEPAWYSASMAPQGDYYVLTYGGPDVPKQYLKSTSNSSFSITLQDNQAYANALAEYGYAGKKYITISVDGLDFNAFVIYPFGYTGSTKYPVLMNPYGGPDSQRVTYQHTAPGWEGYISSQGYILLTVDGRGTSARGLDWLWSTYLQLGILEAEDQMSSARWAQTNIQGVDPDRIALWGWSFGGYMASMVAANGSSVIKATIAVAPVTDWKFYDSAYTERYMLWPAVNADGYNRTSVIPKAANVKPNSLLLIHGTGDDNVHFQQSAVFVQALVAAGVPFQTMYYPNQNHAINTDGSRQHLYRLITQYLQAHV